MKRNIAVLGCGHWGKNLVRNFQALGALNAVCDPTEAGRQLAKELAPEATIYSTPEDVFQDESIEGVVLATPAVTHADLTRQALLANKDVFCEKPLALRYEKAKQNAELAEKLERVLMVGHILEYHPGILKLRELISNGELGQIRYIYSNRLNLGKVRHEENILWSFAPHDIAVILRLIGEMPFQVTATGGAYIQANIADITVTQLLFDNGLAAHIFISWLNPFKEQKLVVVGSKRMITFDDMKKELILYDQRVEVEAGQPIPIKGEGHSIEYSQDEPLRLECQAFLEAMDSRTPPLTDAQSGLKVLRVLQAAQRSLITHGQPIIFPLE